MEGGGGLNVWERAGHAVGQYSTSITLTPVGVSGEKLSVGTF